MVKVKGLLFDAIVYGYTQDPNWDYRETKEITCKKTYNEILDLFQDNTSWSILYNDPDTQQTIEYDNSEFCKSGAITDHRDGTVTIKMGKLTYAEELEQENAKLLYENLTGETFQ